MTWPGYPMDPPTRAELANDEPPVCRCARDTFGNVDTCPACEARAQADEWLEDLAPDPDDVPTGARP